MADTDTTESQLALLAAHRRTLAHLLQQAAAYGGLPFAPAATANGIAQARADIAQIKAALRTAGAAVDDAPGDLATPAETAGAPPHVGQHATGNQNVQVSGQGHTVNVSYASAPPPAQPATHIANQDQIDSQQERLDAERARLADLLIQEAKLGSAWAPPGVTGGIREARANIKRIKKTLADWGVTVADHPDDVR